MREAVRAALADIEPLADLHASADYRRRAAASLAVRAITDAYRAAQAEARMRVELTVNGADARGRGRAAHEPARLPARQAAAHRRACRLRARRVRRLHRAGRRRAGALLPDVRRAGRRLRHHHHRGPDARAGRAVAGAGRVLRDPRHAVRLLHAGHDPHRARAARRQSRADARRTSSRPSPATSAAAPATRRSSRRSRSRPSACAA